MKYILYNHVGSANHGCEALVRTLSEVFGKENIILLSESVNEEERYGVTNEIEVRSAVGNKNSLSEKIYAYFQLKLKKNYFYMDILPYFETIRKLRDEDCVLVSIGGDIYCYENYPKYILLHKFAKKYVKKTILIGCSIEPESLRDQNLLADLKSYDLITAREDITYKALLQAGLTNVYYCPDSAFVLKAQEGKLPNEFVSGNTVGLNISPLVLRKIQNPKMLLDNYRVLMEYIINKTELAIALIPHVSWKDNDDSEPLKILYDEFKESGRVCILNDQPAENIKWYISQCRYFIGARTHATIAAYSTGVPTIAVGYSVKSSGIAKDLFGTTEHYVVSSSSIKDEERLVREFKWLSGKEKAIKKCLVQKTEQCNIKIGTLKQLVEDILKK